MVPRKGGEGRYQAISLAVSTLPRTGLPGRLLVQRGFSRHGPDDFPRAFPQFPRNPREPVRAMLGFKTDASAR